MSLRNQKVSNVSEAFAVLEKAVSEARGDNCLRKCTVAEVEATAKQPALIGSPVIKYVDDAIQRVTTTSTNQSTIEAFFEFANTHHGGEHLESTVFLKAGYPRNSEDAYFEALQDIAFDIDAARKNQCQLIDAQLMWNSGWSFSQWHADLRPRTRAAWSQLQHGRKLWFVASGQRNLQNLLRVKKRDILTWAGEVKRRLPRGVMCCIQMPGEVIYLPPGCAHCVASTEQSSLFTVDVSVDDPTETSRTQALLKRVKKDSQSETDDEFIRPTTQGSSKSGVQKERRLPKRKRKFCRKNSKT